MLEVYFCGWLLLESLFNGSQYADVISMVVLSVVLSGIVQPSRTKSP